MPDGRAHWGVTAHGGQDGHQLLITSSTVELRRGVARWARSGLRRADLLCYAADDQHPSVDRLVESLAGCGVDAGPAAEAGRLAVVEPRRFYSAEGYLQLVERASADGHPGVRTFGGPHSASTLLTRAELDEFEHVLEQLWSQRRVSAVCHYDEATTSRDAELDAAVARHSCGWGHGALHATMSRPGSLRLEGEIDAANDHLLAAVVRAAVRRCGPLLTVDCAGLVFLSVSGWRVLAVETAPLRRAGGKVRLTRVPQVALTVVGILGFEDLFELKAPR